MTTKVNILIYLTVALYGCMHGNTISANNEVQSRASDINKPKEVIEGYLKLDAEGAWFTKKGRNKLQELTSDVIYVPTIIAPTIIKSYRVVKVEAEKNDAWATIEYTTIGYSENLGTFTEKRGIKTSVIRLQRQKGGWIVTKKIFPHIYWHRVVDQIRFAKKNSISFLKKEKDKNIRKKLEEQVSYENQQRDILIDKIIKASQIP